MELKLFLFSYAYHHISETAATSAMMSKYKRAGMLVRTLSMRMRRIAVGELYLNPLQLSTFQYAALHNWIVARITAGDNLEVFELLHRDASSPSPSTTTAATATATTTTARTAAFALGEHTRLCIFQAVDSSSVDSTSVLKTP